MKAKMLFFMLVLVISFKINFAQRDTVIFNQIKGVYEIKYWAKRAGIDTFTTVIFLPSNKVVPKISSTILQKGTSYYYSYKITNTESSKMPLEQFLLELDPAVNFNNKSINNWRFGIEHRIRGCMWFNYEDLQRNESETGFCLESNFLPGIGNAYFQGTTPLYSMNEEEYSIFLEETLKDLMSFPKNYVLKKTVVPVYISPSISHYDYIDTLISINNGSKIYNWISEQSTADKYNSYLIETKSALQQSNNALARYYLKSVLRNVDLDSISAITSEAYALLKYNAEYLLNNIPIADPSMIDIFPSITTTKTKEFTLFINGNNFTPASVIYFDGHPKRTIFVSGSLLKTELTNKETLEAGSYKVYIINDEGNASGILHIDIYKKSPKKYPHF